MDNKFFTAYDRPPKVFEKVDDSSITEPYFRSAEEQIQSIFQAGERLAAYRREQFDFADGVEVPDDAMDPTRGPNFDLADASEALNELQAKADQFGSGVAADAAQSGLPEVQPVLGSGEASRNQESRSAVEPSPTA